MQILKTIFALYNLTMIVVTVGLVLLTLETIDKTCVRMKNKRQKPITWIPSVYFAMGLPFVVLNMVSVIMYKGLGVSDTQIAFWTSLIMLPWTLKFLWSPFLEIFRTKKFFVVMTQMVTAAGFGLLACLLHLPHFFFVSVILLALIALSGATHDIATDGVYMTELDKQEQARFIGWQGAFYNIAKVVATGGLVWLAGELLGFYKKTGADNMQANVQAWSVVMGVLAIMMLLLSLYHYKVLPGREKTDRTRFDVKTVWREMRLVITDFFGKKHIAYYVAFIILYRFAEGFVMKIVPLFLKAERAVGGLGLTEQDIGLYYGTFGAAAFVVGSVLAGYYISYFGLRRTLFSLCCVFNLPFVAYTLLAVYQPTEMWIVGAAIIVEYFGYGFGFVGLTLFMMQQIAPGKHQMSHYAIATGIMNLGVMLPGMISGFLSDKLGYERFFIFILLATIPAFLITYFVPFTYADRPKTDN